MGKKHGHAPGSDESLHADAPVKDDPHDSGRNLSSDDSDVNLDSVHVACLRTRHNTERTAMTAGPDAYPGRCRWRRSHHPRRAEDALWGK